MEKYIYYNGLKFTRDDFSGYYLNSTKRKRLHRYIWECEVGVIPKGYHVHHIDHNKWNNNISNLELINKSRHASHHGSINAKDNYDKMIKNLNEVARPKASEWHGSVDGIEWHKEHYRKYGHKLYISSTLKCIKCGVEYVTTNKSSKFCSNKCKSKYRRDIGVDDVYRVCEVCGCNFKASKYSKTKTCSRSCGSRLSAITKKLR